MNKKMKRFFYVLMASIMLFSFTTTAFAAETAPVDVVNENVSTAAAKSYTCKYTGYYDALDVTTSWKVLATSTTGFDCYVTICTRNTAILSSGGIAKTVVRMLGKNGNVLWTSTDEYSVPGQGSYEYHCGSDVYKIEVKTQAGGGSCWIDPTK